MSERELERFIDNKSLVALKKFAKAEAQLKKLKEQHDEVVERIQNAMAERGITKIDGEWGYITLAEKTTYKVDDISEVDDEFTKPALDSKKVRAHSTLTGELPAGVRAVKTQYITKKLKDV